MTENAETPTPPVDRETFVLSRSLDKVLESRKLNISERLALVEKIATLKNKDRFGYTSEIEVLEGILERSRKFGE